MQLINKLKTKFLKLIQLAKDNKMGVLLIIAMVAMILISIVSDKRIQSLLAPYYTRTPGAQYSPPPAPLENPEKKVNFISINPTDGANRSTFDSYEALYLKFDKSLAEIDISKLTVSSSPHIPFSYVIDPSSPDTIIVIPGSVGWKFGIKYYVHIDMPFADKKLTYIYTNNPPVLDPATVPY